MTVLNVSGLNDFSGAILSGVTVIDFDGTSDIVLAKFAASQFDGVQIAHFNSNLIIIGSAATDMLLVDLGQADGFSAPWQFENWDENDLFVINGNAADNGMDGSYGNDIVSGGGGHDMLFGLSGDDTLNGGAGDDDLFGDAGSDTLRGGVGNDELYTNNNDYLDGPGTVEHLYGGHGHDSLYGSREHSDIMEGGAGMDDLHDSYMLATNSNSDVLRGGAGDDVLRSAGGADVLDGGSGFDTAYVFRLESATNYVIDIRSGGGGTDIGDGTQLSNVEVLDFYGSSGNDTVVGGDFADYVFSDSGQDWLGGCGGDDRLQGGDGEDHIKGGSGDDRISGGNSRDVLNGGAGADTFVYADAAESIAGDEHDVITDFESGMDRIDLSYLKTMISGSTISYVGSSSFTGEAGELRHSFTAGGSAFIQLDLDGNGIADFEIKLTGQVALGISDFVI